MKSKNFHEIFLELLAKPSISEGILSTNIENRPGIFLGVDQDQDLYCLIKNEGNIGAPSKRLKSISVDYSIYYQAQVHDHLVSGMFTSIRLPKRNKHLLEVFSTLLEVLLLQLPLEPTTPEIHEVVDKLVELLSPKKGNLRDRIKGLFGELYLISEAADTHLWIESWHHETNEKKDFSFPASYLEVKTSESQVRKHTISLGQLAGKDEPKKTFLASVLIQSDTRGTTIFNLVEKIMKRTPKVEHQAKILKQVFSVIGSDVDEASEFQFTTIGGILGVKYYETSTVPRPRLESGAKTDRAISGVTFDVNFEIAEAYGVQSVEFYPS
jgi:hypothetical protein